MLKNNYTKVSLFVKSIGIWFWGILSSFFSFSVPMNLLLPFSIWLFLFCLSVLYLFCMFQFLFKYSFSPLKKTHFLFIYSSIPFVSLILLSCLFLFSCTTHNFFSLSSHFFFNCVSSSSSSHSKIIRDFSKLYLY